MIRLPHPATRGPVSSLFGIPSKGVSGGLRTNRNAQKMFHLDFSDFGDIPDREIMNESRIISDKVNKLRFQSTRTTGLVFYPPVSYFKSKNGHSVMYSQFTGGLTSIAEVSTTTICGQCSGTWFFVFCPTRHNTGGGAVFSTATGIGAGRFSFYFDNNSDGNIIVDWGDSSSGGRATIAIPSSLARGTWGVWAVRRSNNTISVYRNGTFVGSGDVTSAINSVGTRLSVGSDIQAAAITTSFTGLIAEIISYKNALSENNIITETKELQSKWNIYDSTVPIANASIHLDTSAFSGAGNGSGFVSLFNAGSASQVSGASNFASISGVSSGFSHVNPRGGIKGLSFNGTLYVSTAGTIGVVAGNDYAMLCVTTPNTQTDAYANIYDWDHGTDNFVFQRNNLASTWGFSHYSASGVNHILQSPTFTIGKRMVVAATKIGTDTFCSVNVTDTTSGTCPSALFKNNRQFRLCGNSSFTRRYNGTIHELAIIDASVSVATLQQYAAELMRKWKV
jgi:hypothetical protein